MSEFLSDSCEYDVVIVGAGVAGALMASKLAEAGVRTLVLEAGPERTDRFEMVGTYAIAREKVSSAPYAHADGDVHAPAPSEVDDSNQGHYIQAGTDRFKSTYQRLAGGSTWHWLGNTPRFLPNDFRLSDFYGVGINWPRGVDYEHLEPWYTQAECELGVSGDGAEWDGLFGAKRSADFPMPPVWPAYGDAVVAREIDGKEFCGSKITLRITPQARNSRPYQGRPPCAGNSSCVPICPIQAKYDATVHIQRARRVSGKGKVAAMFKFQSVVKRLLTSTNGLIDGIEYEHWTGETRTKHHVRSRMYVIAAHAVESPLLLLESGLLKDSPVGKYLMDHPQAYGGAILPDPVYPFRGPPVTSGIDAFRDGSTRCQQAAFRISIGNDGWGRMESLEETVRKHIFEKKLLGETLRRALNFRGTRMLRMSCSTELLPDANNYVEVGGHDSKGNPRPRIHFEVPEYNLRSFRFANSLFNQFFLALGAIEVKFSFPDSKFSGAGHIMGTCRMGEDRKSSVVDKNCRAHDHANLFVVGAATFPTSGTANPTLTVAALALRAAEQVRLTLLGGST
jgi:choline dehydrogenase-like flavoprotein